MTDDLTGDLFGGEPPRRAPPPEDGKRGRDIGIKRAVDHAEAEIEEWGARAYRCILDVARRGLDFTAPDVRRYADAHGLPPPPSKRAWGGPFLKAAKRGMIVRAGYLGYGDETMHHQTIVVWRRA